MKVLLMKNVSVLGQIGDVVEVKPGYARNYLLPHGVAVVPTDANLKAVEAEKQRYLEELAKRREELTARAEAISGREVTISARANEEGHLYGSIGAAQIVAALAEQGIFTEPENIHLDSPIRQLDKYDVEVVFGPDVKATVHVWIVPVHEPEDAEGAAPARETHAGAETEPSSESETSVGGAAQADAEQEPA